jgi:hypothetical protein
VSGQFHDPATLPRYVLDKKLGGPQNRSGRCGEEKSLLPLPGITSRPCSLQPVSIQTQLSWHLPGVAEKTAKYIRIIGVPVKSRTEHLPLDRYSDNNLPGVATMENSVRFTIITDRHMPPVCNYSTEHNSHQPLRVCDIKYAAFVPWSCEIDFLIDSGNTVRRIPPHNTCIWMRWQCAPSIW